VNNNFTQETVSKIDGSASRLQSLTKATQQGLPSEESEDWRYSDIDKLDLENIVPVASPPVMVDVPKVDFITDRAATIIVINGWIVDISIDQSWASKGLEISVSNESSLHLVVKQDYFQHLHHAFSPAVLGIKAPEGLHVDSPIVIINYLSDENAASFSNFEIVLAANSGLKIIEYQSSDSVGLSVPLVEASVGASANLDYLIIQDNDLGSNQIGRFHAIVESQATLNGGLACFGSTYARFFADVKLKGRGASGKFSSAYYGDADQIQDFRMYQHHMAKDTFSDLLFKGVLDDSAKSIYTGLIHIHPEGAGSNAYQTNKNIKLSDEAWAWSVPNLEIENNDVKCSHASTVSPVDLDQQFYLQSRGVPPELADKLIINGFFTDCISKFPIPQAHEKVKDLVKAKISKMVKNP